MSARVIRPEVTAFVEQVRRALDDLSAEEVEELTGGLEADLDDTLADPARLSGQGSQAATAEASPGEAVLRLGDPVAYAAELRAAAGLPPRAGGGERSGAGVVRGVVSSLREAGTRLREWLATQRWWPVLRVYGRSLRPVWWVLRAWIAFQVLHQALSGTPGGTLPQTTKAWLLAIAVLVASLELARRTVPTVPEPLPHGRSRTARRLRDLVVVGNVLAVLALPVALAHNDEREQHYSTSVAVPVPPPNGLWLNGTEVRNVFPYDAQGRPLSGVQLFDERGNPVEVGTSARTPLPDAEGNLVAQVPAVGQDSGQRWNVFPLRQQVTAWATTPVPHSSRAMPYPAAVPSAPVGPLLAPIEAAPSSAPDGGSSSAAAPATPTVRPVPAGPTPLGLTPSGPTPLGPLPADPPTLP
ncbi:MAG TPA: hypothetical protein VFP72_02000 [Kineosporiaceae bacterium]|nr:hypothetical protein [Kineosporiaceae bacterium]